MKKLRSLFLLVSLLAAIDLHAQSYTVTDLGTLGGASATANAINSSGIVVGSANTAGDTVDVATLFAPSGNVNPGSLGGTASSATDINDNSVVVGKAQLAGAGGNYHATLFSGTGSGNTDLGTLGGSSSNASSINNSNIVVGTADLSSSSSHAVQFSGTGSGNTDLGGLAGSFTAAFDINNSNVIVGNAQPSTSSNRNHAATYSGTGSGNTDLGTLGGDSSYLIHTNAAGVGVGASQIAPGNAYHAARYSGGWTDLGTLGGSGSYASSINASGIIVGGSLFGTIGAGDFGSIAFVYRDGTMVDLNTLIPPTPGLMLTYASDINDLGQIDANATLNGVTRAFRLDPTNTPTNTLPNVSYSVSVRVKPKKFGTVKGAGAFPSGAFITLKAKPKIGHTFVCWKEGKKTLSTQRKLSFTLTAAALAPSLNKYRPKPTET